jgi:hypothetical protein
LVATATPISPVVGSRAAIEKVIPLPSLKIDGGGKGSLDAFPALMLALNPQTISDCKDGE